MWRNDVVISGMDVKDCTSARAVAGDKCGEDAPIEELETLERQVINFLTITYLERSRVKSAINIFFFVNKKHNTKLLRQAKKLKGTGVCVNEHLTKKNGNIARDACTLRKQNTSNVDKKHQLDDTA